MGSTREYAGTVTREAFDRLLREETRGAAVVVPVRVNEDTEYRRMESDGSPAYDFSQSRLSAKSVHFPQTETLYTYDFDTIDSVPEHDERIVLFGVRPCDARAIGLLDAIFGPENHGYDDPYYTARRERSLIISLACGEPCDGCFCTSVGGGPADTAGSDLMVHELGDRLVVECVTEAGSAFVEKHRAFVDAPREEDARAISERIEKAERRIEDVEVDLESVKTGMDEQFEAALWERITNACVGCGICTYLCPTCHCFDISDEARLYKGKRIRTWDSCQYPLFTKHASGHNPRPTKTQRLRQRFMHKFSYTVEATGKVYCVGCGRCVRYCPVNLDIREVIREFSRS